MQLSYQQYIFELSFDEKVKINLNSVSIFRSILGMNLKSMCCIVKKNECADCLYSKNCVYCSLFESIIPKENKILEGRNTAPHPYMLSIKECSGGGFVDGVSLKVTLFGKYTEYLPYIYGAFVRSGQRGFGKNRIPFTVKDVAVDGESIIDGEDRIKTDISEKVWKSAGFKAEMDDGMNDGNNFWNDEKNGLKDALVKRPDIEKAGNNLGNDEKNDLKDALVKRPDIEKAGNNLGNDEKDGKGGKDGEILIKLKTPFRYKSGGKLGGAFSSRIEAKDFMNCLYRRAKTLCGFYGDFDEDEEFDAENCMFSVSESDVRWRENERYSVRQKTEMSLGGLVGEFTLKGKFRQVDLDLIEFARIFGAGKNTNFGLGQINVWERLVNSE